MNNAFTAPHFQNHEFAREWLEQTRWPDGPVCSHCGTIDRAYKLKKPGWYRCGEPACRKDFTVTTGTVMERSKVALNKWLMAFYLMSSSKKGVSAHQLHRSLQVDYKTAWFMAHRIREAMRDDAASPMGGGGGVVEADETYFGNEEEAPPEAIPHSQRKNVFPPKKKAKRGPAGKRAIVSLVERGGRVRSFHPARADGETVSKIVRDNINRETRLHTDESRLYIRVGKEFEAHETVTHTAREYARYEDGRVIHTNTVEGYFSIFKRGMRGIYQHCDEKHLHRYLAEYDFRYNHRVALGYSDIDRTKLAIKGVGGKRLTYHQTDGA